MKRLSRLTALLLTLAMLLSLVSIAHAEEKQSATAWLLYFASNHETDSSKFPWWPQHKSADQPSSETGVEATNAEVTGPGMYTVGLKFNWQKAEGAIQFNLVLDNAESLFPGYYVKITDIRVNGKSIDHKPNLYGTFHDDPNAGFAPIYNNYWDKNFSPCGNTALNLLGLSTQVTAVWSYISDGPYKTYEWNSTKLEFKHRTNKEITGLSYMTSLVIQALKTLGRANVTPEIIQTLSEKLSEDEKQACLKEATEATDWVYDTIRKMCGGDTQ